MNIANTFWSIKVSNISQLNNNYNKKKKHYFLRAERCILPWIELKIWASNERNERNFSLTYTYLLTYKDCSPTNNLLYRSISGDEKDEKNEKTKTTKIAERLAKENDALWCQKIFL